MSEDKKRVPKLRFPGFEGEWEEYQADDIFVEYVDKGHPDLPVLAATQEFGMVKREEAGVDIFHNRKNEAGYKRVLPGQFVIHLRSFQGGFAHSDLEGITSPAYTVFGIKNTKQQDDYFWKYIFGSDTFIRRLETVTYGIRDGRSISYKEFLRMKFRVPCYEEQKEIVCRINCIERLICCQKNNIELLQKLRTGLLQKLFPAEGKSIPQVRFPGFTDMWECRKLRDIAEIIGGGTPSTKKNEYWEGDIDWYSPTEIRGKRYVDGSTKKITPKGLEKSSAKLLPGGRTILFTSRASVGDMAILRHSGATNQGFQSLVLRDGYDPYFVYASGIKIKRFAVRNAAGSTFPEISAKQLGNMDYQVPTYEEQQSIGGLMRKIDDLITAHQNKLNHFEKLKKGLLQQMFV